MYTVYKGYDNVFSVQLAEDDVVQDLSAATKVAIIYKGTTYDSDAYATSIDFTTDAATGTIHFKLGIISDLTEGRDSRVELIVYDPANTDGIYWGYLSLRVVVLA
jgi:hypothetical protein